MSEPELYCGNAAVQMNSSIFVFGGQRTISKNIPLQKIWAFNAYTEHWKQHVISADLTAPPETVYACAVAIEPDIYMFGGVHSHKVQNGLWKLSITSETERFDWSKTKFQRHVKLPSPRYQHSGWEYQRCLWVFGGCGESCTSPGYLNDLGDSTGFVNNQLLCYNPSNHSWTNPECFGANPSPRFAQCSTIMMHKVCRAANHS